MEILTDVLTIVTCFYCLLFIHWVREGDKSNKILKERVDELEERNALCTNVIDRLSEENAIISKENTELKSKKLNIEISGKGCNYDDSPLDSNLIKKLKKSYSDDILSTHSISSTDIVKTGVWSFISKEEGFLHSINKETEGLKIEVLKCNTGHIKLKLTSNDNDETVCIDDLNRIYYATCVKLFIYFGVHFEEYGIISILK